MSGLPDGWRRRAEPHIRALENRLKALDGRIATAPATAVARETGDRKERAAIRWALSGVLMRLNPPRHGEVSTQPTAEDDPRPASSGRVTFERVDVVDALAALERLDRQRQKIQPRRRAVASLRGAQRGTGGRDRARGGEPSPPAGRSGVTRLGAPVLDDFLGGGGVLRLGRVAGDDEEQDVLGVGLALGDVHEAQRHAGREGHDVERPEVHVLHGLTLVELAAPGPGDRHEGLVRVVGVQSGPLPGRARQNSG
jgi:hypothetical protein